MAAPSLAQIKAVGDIHEVVPNLFIGNMWSTTPQSLYQNDINIVLNVAGPHADMCKGKYKLQKHVVLTIDDTPDASKQMLSQVIPKTIRLLEAYLHPEAPQKHRILIHCQAGVSRSATIIIAWLMKAYGMSRDEALTFLRSRRSIVNPNEGFMRVLAQYEKYLRRFHAPRQPRQSRSSQQSYQSQVSHPTANYKHHMFKDDSITNYQKQQNQQFERQFSVIPMEGRSFIDAHSHNRQRAKDDYNMSSTPFSPSMNMSEMSTFSHASFAPSYQQEYDEKIYSNDDAFKHLY